MSRQHFVVSTLLTLAVAIQTQAADPGSKTCSGGDRSAQAKCAADKAGGSSTTAKTTVQDQLDAVKQVLGSSPQQVHDKIDAAYNIIIPKIDAAEKDVDEAQNKVDWLSDAVEDAKSGDAPAPAGKTAEQLERDLQEAQSKLSDAQSTMDEVYDGANRFEDLSKRADNICSGSSGSGKCNADTNGGKDNSSNGENNSKDQNKNANNNGQSGSGSGGSPSSASPSSSSQSPFQPINMPTATPDPMQQACAVNPRGAGCPGAPQENFSPATADQSTASSGGNGGGDTGSSVPNSPMDRIARQAISGNPMNNLQNQNELGLPSAGQNMNDSAGRPGNHANGSSNYAMTPSRSSGGGGSYGGSFGGGSSSASPASAASAEGEAYRGGAAKSRYFTGANTVNPARVANNLRLALMRYHRRSPSSAESVGRDGITGPNTDLWNKVRNRYYDKSAGLNP